MGKILLAILRSQWDRTAAIVATVIGTLALINGYIGVSGTAYPAEQIPYIVSGGLVGIFLLGLAATLWLSADLRDEWRKLDELEDRVHAVERRPAAPDGERTSHELSGAWAPMSADAEEGQAIREASIARRA